MPAKLCTRIVLLLFLFPSNCIKLLWHEKASSPQAMSLAIMTEFSKSAIFLFPPRVCWGEFTLPCGNSKNMEGIKMNLMMFNSLRFSLHVLSLPLLYGLGFREKKKQKNKYESKFLWISGTRAGNVKICLEYRFRRGRSPKTENTKYIPWQVINISENCLDL